MSVLYHPTALVARREVTEGFRSRSVKIMLAISVVAVAALIVIVDFAAGSSGPSTTELVVVGRPSAAEVARYESFGDAAGTRIVVTAAADDGAARAAVDGRADVAILDDDTIVVEEPLDAGGASRLATVVGVLRADLTLRRGIERAGLDADEQLAVVSQSPPAIEILEGQSASEDDSGERVGTAIAINIVLFLLLQTYGGWVISGVTREKASRVVEVLLATISARRLMIGKIAGIGVVALIHAAVLITVAVVTAAVVGVDVTAGFRVADVAVGAVWFLLGYALYCSALAAAGSLCSRAEDAQGAALPIMLPLIAGYIVAFSAAGGATPVLWVLSFFPPTAVMCMPVLHAIGAVPVWAVVVSMAITAATALGAAHLAASIFSRSILKTGKRVSWFDALRRRGESLAAT